MIGKRRRKVKYRLYEIQGTGSTVWAPNDRVECWIVGIYGFRHKYRSQLCNIRTDNSTARENVAGTASRYHLMENSSKGD